MNDNTSTTEPVNAYRRDPDHQVDPTTITGSYRALVKREYGKREGDKPLWWVFLYHLLKALGALLPYAVAALIFKACGMDIKILPGGAK